MFAAPLRIVFWTVDALSNCIRDLVEISFCMEDSSFLPGFEGFFCFVLFRGFVSGVGCAVRCLVLVLFWGFF